MKPVDKAGITALAQRNTSERALATVNFVLAGASGSGNPTIAVCFVVYVRQGGFMLAIPNSTELQESIVKLGEESSVEPMLFAVEVDIETLRGDGAGQHEMVLVDLPWVVADHFSVPTNSRGTLPRGAVVIQLKVGGKICRPVKTSVFTAANHWISTGLDEDTAQDYLTGEEMHDTEGHGSQDEGYVQQLLTRISELEARLNQPGHGTTPAPKVQAAPLVRAPPLFGTGQSSQLDDQQWARLHQLAGGPPPRVGSAETRRIVQQPMTAVQDDALVGQEREAAEEEIPEATLANLVAQSQDPLQQMLALQLQQNQMLLKKLMPRNSDPVLGVLSSGSDGGSSSSGNIKGCLARDAFLKAITDLPAVATLCRQNALKELGYTPDREDGTLMKKYMERRIPLQEYRQLTLFATMVAEAWQIGYESRNLEMLGLLARMMFFIEQTAIDGGRTQLSWLLSGWAEPNTHILLPAKKRPGLQPFSRLCSPAWISGNLAFLRDLDFIEGRLLTVGRPIKKPTLTDEEEERPNPKRKPRPKKGPQAPNPADSTAS